jgi:sporulation protein YlmC with PRC-barrel domain
MLRSIQHLDHCSSGKESNVSLKPRGCHRPEGSKAQMLVVSLSATFSLAFAGQLLAAPSAQLAAAASDAVAITSATAEVKPDHACMSDLRTFSEQMQKGGYWLSGTDLGYGYGMYGYGYGNEASQGYGVLGPTGSDGSIYGGRYPSARPGYEIRMLIGSASILAESGESEACRAVLGAARNLYGRYAADLRDGKVPTADVAGWKRHQLASAKPVATSERAYRSDQLIGTDVLTAKGEDIGSVTDLVTSPKTGRISYLVVGRGGVFGIGEKYVPVPWDGFKATPGLGMLVLDTTKAVIDAAPRVQRNTFAPHGDFVSQSAKVDAYWKGKLSGSK